MAEETFESEAITQISYQETAYEDESWEIVGAVSDQKEFVPMEIDSVEDKGSQIDPMFADYGGLEQKGFPRRWHLPEELAHKRSREVNRPAEEEDLVKLREEEIEQIKQAAFDEGKAAATAEAVEESNTRLATIEQRMAQIIQDVQKQSKEAIALIERHAVNFALMIAHKIVDTSVEINPEYIIPLVQEAIHHSGNANIKKIRVSQQDMEFIDVLGIRKSIKDFDGSWDFEGDPTVKSGCVVETSAGEIDFQLDAAWERIKDEVVKVIR